MSEQVVVPNIDPQRANRVAETAFPPRAREYVLYDGRGARVGRVASPSGTLALGANAPALLLRRDS